MTIQHADGGAIVSRVLRGSPARLTVVFDDDETPTDDGAVAVTVTNPAGGTVSTGSATSDAAGTYTYALPAQADLAHLLVTWVGQTRTLESRVEIVGGFYFSLSDARASDDALSDTSKYSTADLREARTVVEDEFDQILGVSYVPRVGRAYIVTDAPRAFNGFPPIVQLFPAVRTILSVTVDGVAWTTDQMAALYVDEYGFVEGLSGQKIVIEYEHGFDAPPLDLRRVALIRLRYNLTYSNSGIPDRATSFQPAEGGTYTLATAGRAGYSTGIPEVDAVLDRRSYKRPGIA